MLIRKKYYILYLFISYLHNLLSNYVKDFRLCNLELELYLKNKFLLPTVTCLKFHSNFLMDINTDIICIDYLYKLYRFKLVYYFLSITYNQRLKIIINVSNKKLPSILKLFLGSNWVERELWDFFGIFFLGSEDLRKILSDYGFKGYALRKDFTLSGYYTLYYSDLNKQLNFITKLVASRENFIYTLSKNYICKHSYSLGHNLQLLKNV